MLERRAKEILQDRVVALTRALRSIGARRGGGPDLAKLAPATAPGLGLDGSLRQSGAETMCLRAGSAAGSDGPWLGDDDGGARIGCWSLDLCDDIFVCSDEVRAIFGWDRAVPGEEPLRFGRYLDAVREDDHDRVRQVLTATLSKHAPFLVEHRIVRSDGLERAIRVKAAVEVDETGAPIRLEGIVEDLTTQWVTEDHLRKLSVAVEQSPASIVITDVRGIIEYVNRTFTVITGYSAEEAVGQHTRVLKSGLTPQAAYKDLWTTVLAGREWRGELCNRKKNGDLLWEFASIAPIRDAQGRITNFLAVKEDLTLRKEYERRLLWQSTHDALTGLPNRVLAFDRLERVLARARRLNTMTAAIVIDVDELKTVNDTLGHEHGDLLLQEAAQRLTTAVRETDTVARLGGDEFAVVLSDLQSPFDAEITVHKIQGLLRRPFVLDGIEVAVSASTGIAVFPRDGDGAVALMGNAEAAMYRSKESGRNGYQFFTPAINDRVHQRLAMVSHLRRAIERGELFLHYQPIFEAASQRLTAVEALVRWQSAEFGSVPPDQFVPLAEETGLIGDIGAWVLQTACAQMAAWVSHLDMPMRLCVNVSSRQFRDGGLVGAVVQALTASGLPPSLLELEITESLLLKDQPSTLTVLDDLTQLGVRLSIDDFGTGYSSLRYLKQFPVSTLKIDRGFMGGVPADGDDTALVTAIVAMAHGLGLRVVGEGVETAGQLAFLRSLGCDMVQGYHLCRALPAEEFLAFAGSAATIVAPPAPGGGVAAVRRLPDAASRRARSDAEERSLPPIGRMARRRVRSG